jgi:hypothetical protein
MMIPKEGTGFRENGLATPTLKLSGKDMLTETRRLVFLQAATGPEDLSYESVPILMPRLSMGADAFGHHPRGMLDFSIGRRRVVRALPWRCFPAARRQLLCFLLAQIRPYPLHHPILHK